MRDITLFVVIVSFSTISLHPSGAVEFKNCGSHFSIDSIEVEDCYDNDESCTLYIGNTTEVTYTLSTGKHHGVFDIDSNLINDVAFYVTGIRFNLTVAPDPCDVLTCPLEKNFTAKYSGQIFVDETYQPLSGITIQWKLKTAEDERLLCFEFPATLKSKS